MRYCLIKIISIIDNYKLIKLFKNYQNLINTQSFYRNTNFTDNSLIKFGKSLETLLALNLLSLNFDW